MKRLLVLFALLFILTVSPSAESGAVTLEPVRITVTTSTPNTTPGATLTIDLLNSSGSDLSPAVHISRTEIKTNLGGVLSFVLDEPDWSAPEYDADYLVRVTYGGVVLSIERLEVVYAKQGLYGALITQDKIDPTSIASVFVPENFLNRETFTSNGTFTVPSGVYKITIEAVGGSGGGGGSGADMNSVTSSTTGATGGGGAGGAGEYAGMFFDVTAGDVISVTIGTAGTLGTAGSMATLPGNGEAGGNGGQTIVKKNSTTVITAYGGSGGGGSVGNSTSSGSAGGALGAGGTGSTAQRHIIGTAGEAGIASISSATLGARGNGVKGLSATGVLTSNQGGMGGNGVVNTSGTGKKDGIAGSIGVAGHIVITYYKE